MKFRLLKEDAQGNKVGPHREGNKRYLPGMVLESNRPLHEIFRGKFERVDDPNVRVSKPEIVILPRRQNEKEAVVAAGEGGSPDDSPLSPLDQQMKDQLEAHAARKQEEAKPKPSKHGADVTEDFPDAELAAMKVYHDIKKDLFRVVDAKSDEVLKTGKSETVITKYLKAQLG